MSYGVDPNGSPPAWASTNHPSLIRVEAPPPTRVAEHYPMIAIRSLTKVDNKPGILAYGLP